MDTSPQTLVINIAVIAGRIKDRVDTTDSYLARFGDTEGIGGFETRPRLGGRVEPSARMG